ncbi:hypothetical protein M406DRAFT_358184, partial [Cryphonectria parasitica EP155]
MVDRDESPVPLREKMGEEELGNSSAGSSDQHSLPYLHDPHHYHPRPDEDVERGVPMSDVETDHSGDEDEDCHDPNEKDHHDGHRPCALETRPTWARSRSRRGSQTDSQANASGLSLSRTISRRETVLSRLRSRPIPQFSHPLTHQKTSPAELVDFDGPDDPYRPLNWSTHKKVSTTLLYGLVTMTATWASSSYSAGTDQIASQFRVSTEVATLGTTLFLLG